MFRQVKSKLESLKLWDSLKEGVDEQGRTPAMCLLGRRGCSSELKAKADVPGNSKVGEAVDTKTGAKGDGKARNSKMGVLGDSRRGGVGESKQNELEDSNKGSSEDGKVGESTKGRPHQTCIYSLV